MIRALQGYRAPLIAGLVLWAGLGCWARLEWRALKEQRHGELRRFADGAFLALDASHDVFRPPHLRGMPGPDERARDRPPDPDERARDRPPGPDEGARDRPPGPDEGARDRPPGPPPFMRHEGLRILQPLMHRMVEAQPRITFMAILRADQVIVQEGVAPAYEIADSAGERVEHGVFIAWRPLGGPPRRHSGGEGEGLPARPPKNQHNLLPLPPGAPVAVIGLAEKSPHGKYRDALLIAQNVGVAALGVVALLLAWVQGIRRRVLAHSLEKEQAERGHLEELSLAASGIAHETKNPLGIIRGVAQRMEQNQELSESAREQAGQIIEEADRAGARLGEFMSYARIRKPELAEVDLGEILAKAASVLAADIAAAAVTVRVEAPAVRTRADREMVLQILLNLVLNSLEASAPGDTLTLGIARTGGWARLTVSDQGAGIAPELLPKVFKPYVTGRPDGHGLGLAIVRRLVEQHGWSIDLHSEPGQGTRVEITGIPCPAKADQVRTANAKKGTH